MVNKCIIREKCLGDMYNKCASFSWSLTVQNFIKVNFIQLVLWLIDTFLLFNVVEGIVNYADKQFFRKQPFLWD